MTSQYQLPSRLTQISADAGRSTDPQPVAIIGIGCRFPGANNAQAFWRLLCDGVDTIREVSSDRFAIDEFYDPRPATPGKVVTRWGGFVDHVDRFDSSFFSISPREASRMDPQHRLLLEVAWEAMEDAGQVVPELSGSRTGVFIGMISNEYEDIQFLDQNGIDVYTNAGTARSVASGRLSYTFDFRGPSVAVDTACSSSLVAVHLACQSIRAGECNLALAGGTNLVLRPEYTIGFSQAGMMAPDGRCKFCDAHADGFVRSDGVGVVVLKPLRQALADRDPIYAVILGSAVNNDGRGSGFLMTPSREGQEAVIREACRQAGVQPAQVQYVEAHGTGTTVGDLVEVEALGAALGEGRTRDWPCIIGSVKTNIGHTEGASGIAGLIKVALSLKHSSIPPSLHLREPNTKIPWKDLPVVVQQQLGPWPRNGRPALAGVSSFGISGTNAHAVLSGAPATAVESEEQEAGGRAELLVLSGHTSQTLEDQAAAYQAAMRPEKGAQAPGLADVCYTASLRRTHHDHRLAVVASSREEMAEHIEAFRQGEARPGMTSRCRAAGQSGGLVFVFPGQGSQWIGMGRRLLEQEPVFRGAIEECHHAFAEHVKWSLLNELRADEAHSRLAQIDVVQPTLFAVQMALTVLWRSWGFVPAAVVGTSMGEIAAAYCAGVLTLPDAARIICRRSQLLTHTSGKGVMAAVDISVERARLLLRAYEDRVSIAVSNSPTSTVLSGDGAAIEEVMHQLEAEEIFCRMIKVDVASHSPQMEPLKSDLLQRLDGIQPRPATIPMYSTVEGKIGDGAQFNREYWWRNLREPVLFSAAVQQILTDGHDIFLEVSPHPVLLSAIQQGLQHLNRTGTLIQSLRKNEDERATLLGSVGALYCLGYPVDWNVFYPHGGRCVPLPAYSWQSERFWCANDDADRASGARRMIAGTVSDVTREHPFLGSGQRLRSAVHGGTHFWEFALGLGLSPFLKDHRVQGMAVLPAAVLLEMALSAAQTFGGGSHVIEDASFKKAVFIPEEGTLLVQLIVSPALPGTLSFEFYSRQGGAASQQDESTLHATGTILLAESSQASSPPADLSLDETRARCTAVITGAKHYSGMESRGLEYGPAFQTVAEVWRGDGEALARLCPSAAVQAEGRRYQLHPALLDGALQVLAEAIPVGEAGERDTYLPVNLDRLLLRDGLSGNAWAHARFRTAVEGDGAILIGDVLLLDEQGRVAAEAQGLCMQRIDRVADKAAPAANLIDWLLEIRWEPKPLEQRAADTRCTESDWWLVLSDKTGVGVELSAQLRAAGATCVTVAEAHNDFDGLLAGAIQANGPACQGVVHLLSLDVDDRQITLDILEQAENLGCGTVLHLVQAMAHVPWSAPPRLWLVTRAGQAVGSETPAVAQSPLWGLGRVISYEHPALRCTRVDLSAAPNAEEIASLARELVCSDGEDQIAVRGNARYVARLVRAILPEPARDVRSTDAAAKWADDRKPRTQHLRLEVMTPGILDNLALRSVKRTRPAAGELEIEVSAAGLNFRDVMIALGIMPVGSTKNNDIGWECAGRVVTVGEGVTEFQAGDEVYAIAVKSLSSFTVMPAVLAAHKPAHVSFEGAATIPITFLTAYYALHHLARLSRGERVLIHSATGGLGLAAIQLAQMAGAEVFATAGSPAKREFLRSMGIQHIMDSRSLAFAGEVLKLTGGEGVDVVLNSLAGEAIGAGLRVLRPGGRFLELGKRDIYEERQLGLTPFRKNLSFFAIDLDPMIRALSPVVLAMFHKLVQAFAEGRLHPLPFHSFPASRAADAFRFMAQAKHIGKVVISMQDADASASASFGEQPAFDSAATYLITGGLGGLGLKLAQWLVDNGAGHLVLVGRRGPSQEGEEVLQAIRETGATVVVAQADVADRGQLARVLGRIRGSMPPLKGVVHAAATLNDGTLLQLDLDRFKSVFPAKVAGAWNLHSLTSDLPLDFFVMFSSGASLIGSPGQGNYSAANAFLDALAHCRRAQGLPALSINWGGWTDVGLAAARSDRGQRLGLRGFGSFSPEQGLEALGRLMCGAPAQIGVLPLDLECWCQFYPMANDLPMFSRLLADQAPAKASQGKAKRGAQRQAILATAPEKRQAVMETHLCAQVARVLALPPKKVNTRLPLPKLGLDSLMAVELKNRIEVDLGITIPVGRLLAGVSVAQLSVQLLDQIAETVPAQPETVVAAVPEAQRYNGRVAAPPIDRAGAQELLKDIDQLPEKDVDALLAGLIAERKPTGE